MPIPKLTTLALGSFVKTPHGLFNNEIIEMRNAYSSRKLEEMSSVDQLIYQKVITRFLQAVIDDERETVAEMLDNNPELLIMPLPENPPVVESRFTHQRFYAQPALHMAVKRGQIKMIECLLPYFDKLEQTKEVIEAKLTALAAWQYVDESNIEIPPMCQEWAEGLIECFKNETSQIDKLSHETEAALSELFDYLSPDTVINLDDYPDVEKFLLALYHVYRRDRHALLIENDKAIMEFKAEQFCIRAIGLVQGFVPPETAKVICQGIKRVINDGVVVGENAANLKLADGVDYYQLDNDACLGVTVWCDDEGHFSKSALSENENTELALRKYIVKKSNDFKAIMQGIEPLRMRLGHSG